MKRLGPELKKPDMKVPTFVEDIYWDLRERRLLPLVALIAVAIVATPFLLGADSKAPPAASATAAGASAAQLDDGSKLTVVQATPGLRDYRKRLSDRDPNNPFKQRYLAPVTDDTKLNPETGGSSETTVPVESEDSGGHPVTAPSESSPGGSGENPKLRLFAFAIKVSVTKSGGKDATSQEKERWVRDRVLPRTPLPGEKAPVVTYMGPSENGQKALLLVSTKVESVFGEIHCVTPTEDICQLVEVEPGFPVTFVYGGNEVHYTVNVIKIEPVLLGTY